jgi:hypothetical protein
VEPARWQELFDQVMGRVAGRFARVEPRRRARALVGGLLSDLPRKNCWTIAEHAGDPSPDGMQHLLARAVRDHDAVRDDVRARRRKSNGSNAIERPTFEMPIVAKWLAGSWPAASLL